MSKFVSLGSACSHKKLLVEFLQESLLIGLSCEIKETNFSSRKMWMEIHVEGNEILLKMKKNEMPKFQKMKYHAIFFK